MKPEDRARVHQGTDQFLAAITDPTTGLAEAGERFAYMIAELWDLGAAAGLDANTIAGMIGGACTTTVGELARKLS